MRRLRVWLRRPFSQRRPRSRVVLTAGLLALCLWQLLVVGRSEHKSLGPYRHNVAGANQQWRFVYFFHHLGLYPVTSTAMPPPGHDAAFAERLMREHPEGLRTEWKVTIRTGEHGSIWLFLPHAWMHGTERIPEMRPANALGFTLALCALFFSFWRVRQPVLGAALVVLVGSDPFQVFEVHRRQNVFGWSITVALVLLALHLPLLGPWPRSRRYLFALPLIAGGVLGCARTLRPEPVAMLASVLMAYLVVRDLRWRTRLALCAMAIGSLWLTVAGWSRYYEHKIAQASTRVEELGGNPYRGPRYLHDHQTWTALWEGLGDFDTTHGHEWSDWTSAAYARPILRERFGVELPEQSPTNKYETDRFWDAQSMYPKVPADNLPHYQEVLRAGVLRDITHHPLWFAGILARRVWRVLDETTPLQILLGRVAIPLPMHGLVAILVAALLWFARARWQARVILFLTPLSLLPIAVFSGLGATYYGLYHVAATAIALTWLVEILRARLGPSRT